MTLTVHQKKISHYLGSGRNYLGIIVLVLARSLWIAEGLIVPSFYMALGLSTRTPVFHS